MRRQGFLGLLAGLGAAALFAACAPVAPPERSEHQETPVADQNPPLKEVEEPAPSGMLRRRVELAIKNVRQRDLLTTHGFWTVFHGILGLGPKTTLLDPLTNKRVNAIDYVCGGNPVRGMEFLQTPYGVDVISASTPQMVFVGQGHQDQFIAEMTQWGMLPDREFLVQGKKYHFSDFINQAKMRASLKPGPDGKKQELSWTLLVIGQYLGTDAKWTNAAGEKMSFDDLLRYELDEPMSTAACGGTHRLFDLTWLYHRHLEKGGKTEGLWRRVADTITRYQELAHRYQHPDGSFSTDFFNGPGDVRDPQRRINTTGHIFEWLALSLTDAQLREPWVEEAANALSLMILRIANQEMEGGTLYHAVHGLILYHARVFDRSELTRDLSVVPFLPSPRTAQAAARK